MNNTQLVWLVLGFAGQVLFGMRFIVQWIESERTKRSLIPVAFWYFSIAGGCTLLAYAIHKRDPVFITGQLTGLFIYLRNLHFVHRERRARIENLNSVFQGNHGGH